MEWRDEFNVGLKAIDDDDKAFVAAVNAAVVAQRLAAGDLAWARDYVAAVLPEWFLNHRNTMDLVTANFARMHGLV